MGSTRAWIALAGTVLTLAACSGSHEAAASSTPRTGSTDVSAVATDTPTSPVAAREPPYTTRHFLPHLTVPPPPWLPPQPGRDERHFLTWEGQGADIDRVVRFMSPVGIYDPGDNTPQLRPVPRDYVRYLFGLRRYGAEVTDRASLDVDGHRATLVTAQTSSGLSGSLGCQGPHLVPDACYGLQTYALVRLAVIDVDGTTLLTWARTLRGSPTADQDFAAFEDLLKELKFR